MMNQPDIFDRHTRAMRQERANRSAPTDRWINARMVEELMARAADLGGQSNHALARPELVEGRIPPILRPAQHERSRADAMDAEQSHLRGKALFVGDTGGTKLSPDHQWETIGLGGGAGLICDEDRFDPGAARYDLIVANGTLDTVNDLPGALIQFRRALAPGGLFLGAFMGAGSLEALRLIIAGSEQSQGKARFHPQIDVRAAGDLLSRAGFAEPVADTETITASYRSLLRLVGDVRANGQSSALPSRAPVSRTELASWLAGFEDARDDAGRVMESFCPVFLTGRSPLLSPGFPER